MASSKVTYISFEQGDERVEVETNMPSVMNIMKRLEIKVSSTDEDGMRTYYLPKDHLRIGPSSSRKSNRPELTFEQRVERVYRLRKGRAEKDKGKPLTKKEQEALWKEAEQIVKDKDEREAGEEEEKAAAEKKGKSGGSRGKGRSQKDDEDEDEEEEEEEDDDEEEEDDDEEDDDEDDEEEEEEEEKPAPKGRGRRK